MRATSPLTMPKGFMLVVLLVSGCGADESGGIFIQTRLLDNPHQVLSATLEIETSRVCRVAVSFARQGQEEQTTGFSPEGVRHRVIVAGMHPASVYALRPTAACGADGPVAAETVWFETGELPPGVPGLDVTVHDAGRVQEGITFFGPARMGQDDGDETAPAYLGVDAAGRVVWYYLDPAGEDGHTDRDLKMLPDGDLLITVRDGLRVIDLAGNTLAEVSAEDAGVAGFHHDGARLPGGGYLTLTSEVREVDVPALGGRVRARGDVVLELDEGGREVWRWSCFDHLDTTRYPTALSRVPDQQTGVYDWTHANAVVYLEEDDSILLSLRHQNQVIKIDRATGEVIWRLGRDGDFVLANLDPAAGNTWFYSQHAPDMDADGTILLYDNGNDRPGPGERFSRAVAYRLDEEEMIAEQIWSYRVDSYTGFLGDADRLGNGNVLTCAGGQQQPGVPARIVEVTGETPAGKVWELELDDHVIYRATRLASLWNQ